MGLFLITHLLNAKEFLKLASSNKEYFEKISGNVEKLKSHLNRDFIDDFPIYFILPFPADTLSVMEYFHMFCLNFGTEMSYSPQFVDDLRKYGVNVHKIDESTSRASSSMFVLITNLSTTRYFFRSIRFSWNRSAISK